MCYLKPFTFCTKADRAISESNLSSSGYSSMASPGPSRCGSSNPLYFNQNDDKNSGNINVNSSFYNNMLVKRQLHNLSINKNKTIDNNKCNRPVDSLRLHSDSETLSDDAFIESNVEGIGTNHIDDKNECVEVKNALEFKRYFQADLLQAGKKLLASDENTTTVQLQIHSANCIVNENAAKELSPFSSRSESPLSEIASGINRFSYHFYGRKDQQFPFTDSDGLYNFPLSDGRSEGITQHKKINSKKRDRKISKISSNATTNLNQIPLKEVLNNSLSKQKPSGSAHLYHNISTTKKSPNRRILQRSTFLNSSSSNESLTSPQELKNLRKLSPQRHRITKVASPDDKLQEVKL